MGDQPRLRSAAVLAASVLSGACGLAQVPYRLEAVPAGAAPVHPVRVAVLAFADARAGEDADQDAEDYTYQGVAMAATDGRDLRGGTGPAVTERVAQHLARARVFAQLVLADTLAEAGPVDLVLTGRVKRLRGYVEAKARASTSSGTPDVRMVLAEVVLSRVELAEPGGRVLFRGDAGWSIQEERRAEPEVPDPWVVLGEALEVAVSSLAASMKAADLSGGYQVEEKVALSVTASSTASSDVFGRIGEGAPRGWRFSRWPAEAPPLGWKGDACEEARFEDPQAPRFSRALGPYVPVVRLWACGGSARLRYDPRAEFPAAYLGRRADGHHYFAWTLGETNWPGAAAELGAHLGVVPPAARHVFEIGR